jgi:WW domain
MNRVWYQHNVSQYKTYIRPMTAGLNGLLAGWQERQNPEGRTYYFHANSGKSTWTKPGRKLPLGWKEVKTPDEKPFYVHEEYQLSTWHWPGQQPSQQPGQQPGQNDNPPPSQKPSQKKEVAPAGNKAERSVTNRRASATVSGVTTAATLSTNALDLASDPIMGTTKAIAMGARWATRGFKGKKAKKMLNQVGMKNIKKLAGAAINIAADGDDFDLGDDDGDEDNVGDGDDGGDAGEGDDEDVCGTGLTDSTNDGNSNGYDQNGYGNPQQDVSSDSYFVEPQSQSMGNQPFMQQGCGVVDSYGQVSNVPDCYQEEPQPMINNVNIIENNESSNTFVDQGVDNQTIDQSNQIYADQSVNYQTIDQNGQNYGDQSINYQYIDQSNNQAYVDQSINNQSVDQMNIDAQQTEFVYAEATASDPSAAFG